MRSSRQLIKILVTDYDACLLVPQYTSRNDYLSEALIQHAKNRGYAGFYACTHRTYNSILYKLSTYLSGDNFYDDYIKRLSAEYLTQAPNCPFNLFTFKITENFSNATGLSCFAVSTPDDFSSTSPIDNPMLQCGYGFTHILKLFETEIISASKPELNEFHFPEKPKNTHEPLPITPFNNSKNNQLLSIAQHAHATFGADVNIEIHFIDDNYLICNNVAFIQCELLPNNVKIKSFRHAPGLNFSDLTNPIASVCAYRSIPRFIASVVRENDEEYNHNRFLYTSGYSLFDCIKSPLKKLSDLSIVVRNLASRF